MVAPNIPFLKNQKDLKPILAGVFTVVGVFTWWQLFLIPSRATLMDAKLQLSTLQKDVARIKEKSARIDSMRSELERLAAQYDVAITATLPEEQLPEVLDAIAAAARVSGVRLIGIKPKEEVSHLTPSASGFLELPIQVDALGGYHHLGRFLSAVEESKVLVGVQELTIQANPEDIWNHKALFVFVAYLFPAREGAKS